MPFRPMPSCTASRPRQVQNPLCPMLQLPIDLVVDVISRLPRHHQILVSQTCRALRTILCHHFLRGDDRLPAKLPRKIHLEFLLLLAQNLPDQWVCDECVTLHQARMRDTPRHPTSADCPWGFRELQYLGSHGIYGFKLNHRHVQLTLKHVRLASTAILDPTYLQKLLAPHHGQIKSRFTRRHIVEGRYSAYPKVVEGRYLVKSIWDFQEGTDKVLRQYLGTLRLCEHQIIRACDINPQPGQLHGGPTDQDTGLWDAFKEAVRAAYESPCEEIPARCNFCGTDFSVEASPERVTVRAWQDFGPEGTSLNRYWRAHVNKVHSSRTACRIAGSIRKVYGDCEDKEKQH